MRSLFFNKIILIFLSVFVSLANTILAKFGTNGLVVFNSPKIWGYSLLIQPDAKIIMTGVNDPSNPRGIFVRSSSTGVLDTNFGINGFLPIIMGDNYIYLFDTVLLPDGSGVASGFNSLPNQSNRVMTLVKFSTTGNLDSNFGTGGLVTTPISESALSDLVLSPDGKLIAVGTSGSSTTFIIARYNPNGSLDSTFGANGIANTIVASMLGGNLFSLILQPDGKLVACGFYQTTTNTYFILIRYMPNGTLDSTFGNTGIATTSMGTGEA
jgi:uncharacterized delta-60 repeat protein